MQVNEIQIGGDHYKTQYQPWDFICDINLHFLLANAVKYIHRWRHKGQPETDLRKALHYLAKAEERDIKYKRPFFKQIKHAKLIGKFQRTLNVDDARIVSYILYNNLYMAKMEIELLIRDVELCERSI